MCVSSGCCHIIHKTHDMFFYRSQEKAELIKNNNVKAERIWSNCDQRYIQSFSLNLTVLFSLWAKWESIELGVVVYRQNHTHGRKKTELACIETIFGAKYLHILKSKVHQIIKFCKWSIYGLFNFYAPKNVSSQQELSCQKLSP